MPMEPGKRVFSEQEVTEIIRRAAELQEGSASSDSEYRPGVTREELERAAAEVGVSPQFLQQAIQEKLAGIQGRRSAGLAPEEERVVEGELDPNDYDVVVEQLPLRSSRRYPVSQIGRSLQARAMTGSGIANVSLHSRNGRTRIRVKPLMVLEALGSFYPAFLLSMMAGGPLAEAGHGALAAGIVAGAWTLATAGFFTWARKSRKNASKLADRIEAIVAEELENQARKRPETAPAITAEPVEERFRSRQNG